MLQPIRCFAYNISRFFIVQMYAGISPEILQFLKTLKCITELYQKHLHQIKHIYKVIL